MRAPGRSPWGVPEAMAGAGLTAGQLVTRAVSDSVTARGLFHGVEPSGALLPAVETALASYHVRMDGHVSTELADLPDYHLDTGVADAGARDDRLAIMAKPQLNQYRET